MSNLGWVAYGFIGLIWVWLEHKTFDIGFEDCSPREAIITVSIQTTHYLKVFLLWPLYIIEDFLLYLASKEEID